MVRVAGVMSHAVRGEMLGKNTTVDTNVYMTR